jgi:hypothetical protein
MSAAENVISIGVCATGTVLGATVSALVYSAMITSGEITASVTSSGINITGELIAKGTEYFAGKTAGDTIRTITKASSAIAKPTIANSSKTFAAGMSLIAGTVTAITTSAIIYGAKGIGSTIYNYSDYYKGKLAQKVQYPVEMSVKEMEEEGIFFIEDTTTAHPNGHASPNATATICENRGLLMDKGDNNDNNDN